MLSLRQILADESPVLLLDAASATVQAGWLESPSQMSWAKSSEESGVGMFRCLEQLQRAPKEAAAFIFCDGPGSVLGVRTAAMAIRTWTSSNQRPIYAFHSLAVVAHQLADPAVTVIADARRDCWHTLKKDSPLTRVPTAELTGPLVTPEGFRNWTPLPQNVSRTPYELADIFPRIVDEALFRLTETPDAFLHEEPNYAAWIPRIHRAP